MVAALLALLLASGSLAQGTPDSAPAAAEVVDRSAWTAERWLEEVDARAEALPGLRYSARRETVAPSREGAEIEIDERWRFILLEPDRFRIDYFGDTARQITCDGVHLVDYVPANGRAIRHHLPSLDGEGRAALVKNILAKVSVPGWRVGRAEGVAWTLTPGGERDGRPVVVLQGDGDDGSLRYEIDTERVVVLRSEIHSAGQVALRTDSSDLREIFPGTWFPHEVSMRAPGKGGEVRVTLHLTKVGVVTDSPDDLFRTTLDPSIPMEERP